MTISVNVHEAKAQLSGLLAAACKGEEVVICVRNRPTARIQPLPQEPLKKRVFGTFAKDVILLDGFDDPIYSVEELDAFANKPL